MIPWGTTDAKVFVVAKVQVLYIEDASQGVLCVPIFDAFHPIRKKNIFLLNQLAAELKTGFGAISGGPLVCYSEWNLFLREM